MESTNETKLFRPWNFWYIIPDRSTNIDANWRDFLHSLCSIESVEDIWSTLNAIEPAHKLPKGCRYYVFKKGVLPLWEDRSNINGYEISIEHQISGSKKANVTERWIDVILACLGETLTQSKLVNGIEFSVRAQNYKIGIWTAPCEEEEVQSISADLKKLTNWQSEVKVIQIKNK
ncbi:eukaryotic translation initiation factor 4E [Histomonas meleagridis]|uniref:eukaryotic translation initiation factor 4E n=1 Tax=Histomonas meleagridis TaxID=135588 RepID=UPI0035598E87|nr:eukaryotic translation initiation factor 4E [Histomonas meleagridis]KAH0801243.1 eukaryotic translation initiation factor 4E [Histomonas meleagridis]